jgi:hypothetical protein
VSGLRIFGIVAILCGVMVGPMAAAPGPPIGEDDWFGDLRL